jgi:protein involved in polysaccharide export with SLBB domain
MKTIGSLIGIALLCSCAAPQMRDPAPHMVTVQGEVRRPGDYALIEGMTVRQAVTAADGYTDFASGIIVNRGEKRVLFVTGRKWRDQSDSWDIQLQDKDVVFVRRTD